MIQLRIARVVEGCEVVAPETALGVWVQGCSIHCPGCSARALWDPSGGRLVDVRDIVDQARARGEGIAILGGEPLDQPEAIGELCRLAREAGMGVTLYTGRDRESAIAANPWIPTNVDLLLAGPFVLERRREDLPFVGSDNQTADYLSGRYNTVSRDEIPCEIHIGIDGAMTLLGYPGEDLLVELKKGEVA